MIAAAPAVEPTDFTSHTYRSGEAELGLDVFSPQGHSQHCCVLVLHGGGWRGGSREAVHDRCRALTELGLTAIAVQYRLLSEEVAWPAPLQDAEAALAWARENSATFDFDPAAVVIQGHSAGAHIALLTGSLAESQRPAAIAAYYPPIGFHDVPPPTEATFPPVLELDALGRVPSWMLFAPGTSEEELIAASPFDQVDVSFPPTIILHGGGDTLVNVRSSTNLNEKLRQLGVPSDLHIYSGLDHEFDAAPSMRPITAATTSQFVRRFVTQRSEAEAEALSFRFPPSPDAP